MVKSNRVAVDLGDNQLASPSSKADATPLLQQGSGDYIKEASSPPKKSAARQRKSEKSSGAQQNYLPDASLQVVLEDWEPPNDKAAKLAHVKTHYHHELFSLSDTKTEDLAEFGQGLALYFYFLKWIAMLLAAMSLVVLPNMVWSAVARSSGTSSIGLLVATSLGAYGPLFGSDYVYNATGLADALTSLGVTFPNNQLQRDLHIDPLHQQMLLLNTCVLAFGHAVAQGLSSDPQWLACIKPCPKPYYGMTLHRLLQGSTSELQLEYYFQNASVANATVHIPLGHSVSKQQLHLWACWLDLASVLLYLVVVFFIILYQQRVLEEVASKTVTVIDYSVQVWDLPKDAQSAEVQAYFSQWGPVHSCQLAHNDLALIALISRQGPLQVKYEHAVAAAQKSTSGHTDAPEVDINEEDDEDKGSDGTNKRRRQKSSLSAAEEEQKAAGLMEAVLKAHRKLQQLQEAIRSARLHASQRRCVCAFVTFKTEEACLKCMQANPSSRGKRWAQRRDKRFRKRHALRVGAAPEPSDIVWENLQITTAQRLQRRVFILVVNLIIIFVGFILVNLAASWRKSSTNLALDPPSCATSCNILSATSTLNLTASSEAAVRYKGCYREATFDGVACSSLEQSCFSCYCSIAIQTFAGFSYCKRYWLKYIIQVLILVAAALITTVTNKLLYYFALYTNHLERHHTQSAEQRSLTLKLFMAQFVNTALSSLVANMYIPALYKRLHNTFLGTLIFQGIYADLVPAWYAQVGQSLTIVIVFTVGLPHPAFVLYRLVMYKWKLRQRKFCLTQAELVKSYEGPDFDLADRYGELLNILFCTLMFSGGLPLVLPLVSIIFAITYWAEKWELLKLSRVPSPYSGDLAALTGNLLPWAAFFHLMFSVWAFSWAKWPQENQSRLADSMFGTYVRKVGVAIRQVLFEGRATQDYGSRVLQPNAVPHALALVILLALLFTRLFGGQVLSAVGQAFALLGMGRSSKYKLTNLPSLAIAVRSRLLIGPGSYSMEKHDKYGEVFAAPDSSALQGLLGADHKDKGSKKQNKVYKTPEA